MRVPVHIGLSLSDLATSRRIASEVGTQGSRAVELGRSEILAAVREATIHALIYDLEPGDGAAAEVVSGVRRLRPHLPIWLHYPPRPELTDLAARLALLPRVVATPQRSHAAEETEVRSYVAALLSDVPRVRLERLIKQLVGSVPPAVQNFVEASLDRLDRGGALAPKVQEVAADAGLSQRWLEKSCAAASLPHPKRLLDHLIFVYVGFMSWSGAVTPPAIGRHLGLLSKDLARIRRHVLGTSERWGGLRPVDQFALATIALGRACHMSAPVARDAVEEFLLESAG